MTYPAWLAGEPPPPAQGRLVVKAGIVQIPQPPKHSAQRLERWKAYREANRDQLNARKRERRKEGV